MIPLQVISQTKYIIKGDTIIGYTHEENRTIALIFLDGERDKELLINCNELNRLKDSIIIFKNNYISIQDNTIKVTTDLLNTINIEYEKSKNDINKLEKSNKKNNTLFKASLMGNIILILILLL